MIAKKNKQIFQMENVDAELGRDVNVVQNTVQSLLDCVENYKSFTNKFSPSIYMAPSTLRDLSKSSFNPRVVSTGPLHSEDVNVQPFEGKKAKYVHDLLERPLLNTFSSAKIQSAVELDRAGVNFKPNRMAMEVKLYKFLRFPWSLGKPTIRMPVLRVHHFTELVFRNIIAYEQSSLGNNHVTSYAIAMDMLIDTQEDVAKLVESKVLVNNIGSNEEAANMMNSICKEVAHG
ncbi:putative UPF0481 protein, partial [Tanacetum coccineum]